MQAQIVLIIIAILAIGIGVVDAIITRKKHRRDMAGAAKVTDEMVNDIAELRDINAKLQGGLKQAGKVNVDIHKQLCEAENRNRTWEAQHKATRVELEKAQADGERWYQEANKAQLQLARLQKKAPGKKKAAKPATRKKNV
jgi:hypothetical protein